MQKLINKLTGRLFWWQVKHVYRDKNGKIIFTYTSNTGTDCKSDILNHRKIKKESTPLNKVLKNMDYLLNNGNLEIEIICYLGYLKIA